MRQHEPKRRDRTHHPRRASGHRAHRLLRAGPNGKVCRPVHQGRDRADRDQRFCCVRKTALTQRPLPSAVDTMAARPVALWAAARQCAPRRPLAASALTHAITASPIRSPRPLSTSHPNDATPASGNTDNSTSDPFAARRTKATHFGFETVTEWEKTERVAGVFHSVADSYDKMNDLMSFGWHRVWKDHFVRGLSPGLSPDPLNPSPMRVLDVAGGTGDIAFRMLHHAHVVNSNPNVRVTISDINPSMLAVGRSRAESQLPPGQLAALSFLEADATDFLDEPSPSHPNPARPRHNVPVPGSLDLYTVAFGIRNFTDIPGALREAYRALRPGGVFACLEFSKADANPLFNAVYKRWSFGAIPLIGQLVAGDRDSYQYLVESIERFPSQRDFRDMIAAAGFDVPGKGWEDLTGGVAAIHKGVKPLDG
ncbi:hypothetical protein RB594_001213 [Gaeumannomyces avenae]